MTRDSTGRVVVLDNEALQSLADPAHRKHRRLLELLEAGDRRRVSTLVVATAVRVEAGIATSAPAAASLGRFKVEDVPLDGRRADQAIALASGLSCSVVDATVAQVAEELAASGARVTVYTSDVRDLEQLCRRATGRIAVRRV